MSKKQDHILVAALCWGLGHATRCIPIIRELLRQGFVPVIASDGVALDLLRQEFPEAVTVELPAYNILYRLKHMFWNMAIQDHKIVRAAFLEHRAVKALVSQYGIKVIISDNRYGCYHHQTFNIFISHQLEIRIRPRFFQWLSNLVQRLAMKNFQEIWVPDSAKFPGLAGSLSHPGNIVHPKLRYIGPLSRMSRSQSDKTNCILVVLSGPEPQRTTLEQIVVGAAAQSTRSWLIVRGVIGAPDLKVDNPQVQIVNYLTSEALNVQMLQCDFMIARSGYSTIMDLAATGTRAVLVPTPGQTEQEYLAEFYAQLGIFMVMQQEEFDLQFVLDHIHKYPGIPHRLESTLEQVVAELGGV